MEPESDRKSTAAPTKLPWPYDDGDDGIRLTLYMEPSFPRFVVPWRERFCPFASGIG